MKGRRIVWQSPETVVLEEFAIPSLQPGSILVETECTAVSPGTELAFLRAEPNTSGNFPQYPGYSGVGKIIDISEDVEGLSIGDRVIMDHCGHASHAMCKATGWRGQGFIVIDDSRLYPAEIAFMVIASMSLQGVRKARLELGESAMVMGLGLLGLFAVQLCRLSGAAPVIAVDYNEGRLRLAEKLGADYALSPADNNLEVIVKNATYEKGVNAVIEVTGTPSALPQGLTCCAMQGRIVLLGCAREQIEGINYYQSVHKTGVSIIGAHNFVRPLWDSSPGYWTTRDDMRVLLSLLGAGRLQARPMISEETSPENAPEVYRRFLNREEGMLGVVFKKG